MTKSARENLIVLVVFGAVYAMNIGMSLAGFSTYDVVGGTLISSAAGALIMNAFTMGIPPRQQLPRPKLREVGIVLGMLGIAVAAMLYTRKPMLGTLMGPATALGVFVAILTWPFRLGRLRA